MEDAGTEEQNSTIPALACRYMKKTLYEPQVWGSIPKTDEMEIERKFLLMQDSRYKMQVAGCKIER